MFDLLRQFVAAVAFVAIVADACCFSFHYYGQFSLVIEVVIFSVLGLWSLVPTCVVSSTIFSSYHSLWEPVDILR